MLEWLAGDGEWHEGAKEECPKCFVYVRLESGLVVKHTLEEYERLMRDVDIAAARKLGCS